jgi:cell division transport system permease protein
MRPARLIHRLRYFVTDAWDEWRHSPGVNLLAVVTLASTLFLAGLVLLVLANLEHQLQRQRDNIQVQVFLADDVNPVSRSAVEREIGKMAGVVRVDYIDKAEAVRRYSDWAGQLVDLLDELETNPLPASLEVTLQPGPEAEAHGEAIVDALGGRPVIEEVRFDRDWLRKLESLLGLARIGGSGLAMIVFAAVVIVMASVLRLAVYARRDEIGIMLLVGATPSFVRGPFLVAGLGQGLLASVLAVLLVEGTRRGALAYAGAESIALVDLILERGLPLEWAGLMLLVGLAVSLVSAFFAVRASI